MRLISQDGMTDVNYDRVTLKAIDLYVNTANGHAMHKALYADNNFMGEYANDLEVSQVMKEVRENSMELEFILPMSEHEEIPETDFEDIALEELDLSVRAYNRLKYAGCRTIQDIIDLGESGVRKLRQLGEKSLNEIETEMRRIGAW